MILSSLDPEREFDLAPFAKEFLKHEPENLNNYLDDPLSRKSLEVLEIIESVRKVGSIRMASISPDLPILVLRGKNDCVCKGASVTGFLKSMKSKNMTIHRCTGCGHLILQGREINDEILQVLCKWLADISERHPSVCNNN